MPAEWQGDHRLVGGDKDAFEKQLRDVGLEPSDFLVQVRRHASETGSSDSKPSYDVYISDLKHPDHETHKLEGGPGKDWVAEFARLVKRRG
jgi:hypothetical protein